MTQVEIATDATQSTQHTRAVQTWLAKIQKQAHRDTRMFWGFFIFFQMLLFVPIGLSNSLATGRSGHFNPVWIAMLCHPA